jgi:hypothetical protein
MVPLSHELKPRSRQDSINANGNDGHAVYPTAEHPAVFAGVFQHTLFSLCKVAVVQAFYFIRDGFSIFRFRAVFVEDGFEPFHQSESCG